MHVVDSDGLDVDCGPETMCSAVSDDTELLEVAVDGSCSQPM